MKRTNETENAEPGSQAKRTKGEDDETDSLLPEVEAPADGIEMKDTTEFQPTPLPVDVFPLHQNEGTSITNNDFPPPPQFTQTPPLTLAELTIARANRNNALEAAQHQLATAVLRQNQAEDAFNQCRLQQNAAVAELMRQQAGYGTSPALTPNGAPMGGGILDPSSSAFSMGLGGVTPFPIIPAAAAEAAMGQSKLPPTGGMLPNYNSMFLNPLAPGYMAQNTANFMSLSKEEQQNQLLALAKSTQTGVSTSKKHGPYIPGVVTRGEGFYDPGAVRELALPSDRGNLSEYQCLLRKQIVLFSVTMNDIQCSAQGRNKPIVLGQVGVLCRHCSRIPPGMRPCGAAYFPAKLSGLYQASQNMAINHFTKSCRSISEDVRENLVKLKAQKSTVLGGGKHFWANGAKVLGVIEMEDGLLRFKSDEATEDTVAAAAAAAAAADTATAPATNESVKT